MSCLGIMIDEFLISSLSTHQPGQSLGPWHGRWVLRYKFHSFSLRYLDRSLDQMVRLANTIDIHLVGS